MKKQRTTLAAVLLAVASGMLVVNSYGQSYFSNAEANHPIDFGKAEKSYIACLNSDNDGVIESGLAHAANMRIVYRQREFVELEKAVKQLVTTGKTGAIRYKASLVAMLFENPALFAAGEFAQYDDASELYTSLATRLQQNFLSYSSR